MPSNKSRHLWWGFQQGVSKSFISRVSYLSFMDQSSHAHFVYVQSNVYNFHNIYIKKYFFELDGNLCENYNNYYWINILDITHASKKLEE